MNNKNRKKFNIYLSIFAVVAIVATMFFSCISVHAEGSFSTIEALSVSEDTFKRSDFDISSGGIGNNDTWLTYYENCYNNGFSYGSLYGTVWEPFVQNNNLTHYYAYFDTVESFINLGAMDDSAFIVCNNNYFRVYTELYIEKDNVYGNNGCELAFRSNGTFSSLYQWGYDQTQNIDGTKYIYREYQNLVSSNLPMYYFNSVGWSFDSLDDLQDLKNPIASSGSGPSKEDIKKHGVLKQGSKIYLTNNSFDVGSLLIYPVLDTEQAANPNKYKLRFTGSATYTITYNNISEDVGHVVSVDGTSLKDLYGFRSDRVNTITSPNFVSDSGNYLEYSFSELLSGSKTISLDQLNAHYYLPGRDRGLQPLAAGLDHTFGGSGFWTPLIQAVGGMNIMGFQFDFTELADRYDCVPTSAHYLIEAWVVVDGVQSDRPSAVIDVDLVSGVVTPIVENYASDQDIMDAYGTSVLPQGYSNNSAPINPNNMQGTVSNSATASSGGAGGAGGNSNSNSNIESGAVVINNNPTFNNDNSSSLSSKENSGLIPFILGLIAGNKKASTNTVEDMANTSGWLSIIQTTFSFVPVGVWNLLIGAFTAAIGIMIVSFILGIIIKFIT